VKPILDVVKDNAQVVDKLKAATSVEDAARILVDACKQAGQHISPSEVATWLTQRSKASSDALSDEDLQAVSGGIKTTWETKLTDCSKICCSTCRTTSVWY
jgi:hypothetical protein